MDALRRAQADLDAARDKVRAATDARSIAAAEASLVHVPLSVMAECFGVTKSAAAQFVAEGLSNPTRARESSQHPHVSRTRTGVTSPATTRPSAVQQRHGRPSNGETCVS